ncbi:SGNH/GDSL hydrolase family protein [Mesorhizobium sp. BAC0120]|uniref:SGNH/GDSL hydrolase family protein n=1 Tax=Mesorhizobium sp. BAC0120 TaxID=3090670 RepID=UPI00298C4B62|nr:SGNH/GDSL hydrolase family protein [Mesorhizobium sp. BAC0120]MDW6022854.1 SGNH/GDSL hydrolase family protein [Mesorhizobium sp. BAC0120]
MKTILCYGDSLTWGYDAQRLGRHAYEDRWPSILQSELGTAARVIPEGLNGRTTAYDDHLADADRNGVRTLPTLLATHEPLDLVIILLGTNDLKPFICGDAIGIRYGMERLVQLTRNHVYSFDAPPPAVLVVSPPLIRETENADFAAMFDGGISESKKLAGLYSQIAEQYQCGFFDAGTVAKTTPLDGIHLDAENTRAIGKALAPIVRNILNV